MKSREKYMLLKTVQDNNILPITSYCNMNCVFCSHHYNPLQIQVYRYGSLNFKLIKELIEYLSPDGPVILGESATKIIEGEPFTHPQIYSVLAAVRNRWPKKEIKITTNGSLLNKKSIHRLSQIGNIKLNISLNCSSPEERVFLMNDKNPTNVFNGLSYLDRYNINFNGSTVALPHIMGWKSISKTVEVLAKYEPETIRIFLPGFTCKTPEKYQFDIPDLYDNLKSFVDSLKNKYDIPLILEPPVLSGFNSRVLGTIEGTPAANSEIKAGDIIKEINGYQPQTRVETFNLLNNNRLAKLTVKRKNKMITCQIEKKPRERSGIVLNYDLHPDTIREIINIVNNTPADRIIIITSVMGQYLIKRIVNTIKRNYVDKNIIVRPVKNKYFGGSIMSAGLLVNSDIIDSLKNIDLPLDKSKLIILPGIIYDIYGNDLIGRSYQQLEEVFAANIEIVD